MQSLYGGIGVGDRVRSYDFEGRTDCNVEGTVEAVEQMDCPRFRIRIVRRVFAGKDVEWTREFPGGVCLAPVNGLPKWTGGVTASVVRLDKEG